MPSTWTAPLAACFLALMGLAVKACFYVINIWRCERFASRAGTLLSVRLFPSLEKYRRMHKLPPPPDLTKSRHPSPQVQILSMCADQAPVWCAGASNGQRPEALGQWAGLHPRRHRASVLDCSRSAQRLCRV